MAGNTAVQKEYWMSFMTLVILHFRMFYELCTSVKCHYACDFLIECVKNTICVIFSGSRKFEKRNKQNLRFHLQFMSHCFLPQALFVKYETICSYCKLFCLWGEKNCKIRLLASPFTVMKQRQGRNLCCHILS
jgi:hypothetical protein